MKAKVQQQKTKECSLYGYLIQLRSDKHMTGGAAGPHAKLLEFCHFLVGQTHSQSH